MGAKMVAEYSKSDNYKSDNYENAQMIELETKMAFQEDAMQKLNDVVAEQQQDILALRNQMTLLIDELGQVLGDLHGDGGVASNTIEKPPHY